MNIKKTLYHGCCILGFASMFSCVNSDFDLSKDINLEMTFGGNLISLPVGNMDTVYMSKIIEESENIKIGEDGKYMLTQSDNMDPVTININKFSIKSSPVDFRVDFSFNTSSNISGLSKSASATSVYYPFSIVPTNKSMIVDNNVPDEVKSLKYVDFTNIPSCNITFKVKPLQGLEKLEMQDVLCQLPDFIEFDKSSGVEDGLYKLNSVINVLAGETKSVKTLKIKSLDFTKINKGGIEMIKVNGQNKLQITQEIRVIDGKVGVTGNPIYILDPEVQKNLYFDVNITIDEMEMNEVVGFFNPTLDDINENISLDLGSDADFLKDATLDFNNPQLYIGIKNNVKIPINIDFKLWGENADGVKIEGSDVSVNNIKIDGAINNGIANETKLVIAKSDNNTESDYKKVIVPELSNLLKQIPDNIKCQIVSKTADGDHSVNLQKEMIISGDYRVKVPLEFDYLDLIYTEKIEDLQSDLSDISDLQDEYEVHLVANIVNAIPLNLNIKALPFDKQGKEISSKYIKVEVIGDINAGGGDKNPSTSEVKVKLLTFEKGLEQLDRIDLGVKAQSGSEKVVFEESHFLVFKDMKLKIIGGITIDGNK